jgi:hypothetical protein
VANYELERCSALTDLIGARVEDAEISRESLLTMTFGNRGRLVSRPHPDYEAWQVEGPQGFFVVCLPSGGEPAIWDETVPPPA